MTGQRRAVLQAIEELGCARTAEEIHTRARRIHPGLGLVTVYRTLGAFIREGRLERFFLGDARARYEMAGNGRSHHHHLVCLSCGEIEPLDRCFLSAVAGAVRRKGFTVTAHRLELFGYCARCGTRAR